AADQQGDRGSRRTVGEGVPEGVERGDGEGAVGGRGGVERPIEEQPVAVGSGEGPLDEYGQWQDEQHGDDGEGAPQQRPLSTAVRPSGGPGGVDEPQGGFAAPYGPGVQRQQSQYGRELEQGQHGGGGQVQE